MTDAQLVRGKELEKEKAKLMDTVDYFNDFTFGTESLVSAVPQHVKEDYRKAALAAMQERIREIDAEFLNL